MSAIESATRLVLEDMRLFSRFAIGRELRGYQLDVARAVLDSVLHGRGLTFVVAMSRQAGKNETQAQLEAYLMTLFQRQGGFLVKASPTYKPQTINSLMRLQRCLDNPLTLGRWQPEHGHMIRLGRARALFFSAQLGANVVGATADVLLQADEAQDIDPARWAKAFRPMGASTNATCVLWGTMWTAGTLLGRTRRALEEQQARDGLRRVFLIPWQRVAEENPAYGEYVRGEIARLGENSPIVRTQYCLEEIDGAGGLFPPQRVARMHGDHPRQSRPTPGREYALLIDVGGEELNHEDRKELNHDATALTVVEIVRHGPAPVYRVVDRRTWTGASHTELYEAIVDLAVNVWKARKVVVDATGLGAGLASFLKRALGERLVPFVFSASSKSDLGWRFLSIVDTGRYQDYADDSEGCPGHGASDTALFWRQVAAAGYELLDGPGRLMRWSVADRELHDDLLISAALVAVLDKEPVSAPYRRSAIIEPRDEG